MMNLEHHKSNSHHQHPGIYHVNIEKATLENTNYREPLYTNRHMQLVVMSLQKGEDIPSEVHRGSQFIRVESGDGEIVVDSVIHDVHKDDIVIIDAGKRHYVRNKGNKPLKLYSIYTPPEHDPNHIDVDQPRRN